MFIRRFTSLLKVSIAISLFGLGLSNPRKTSKKSSKGDKKPNFNTIYLSPGNSIQDALDNAPENTIIYLSSGDYVEDNNVDYGLRVTKNKIKLIGETGANGSTRILHTGDQQVGVYVAPEGCEFRASECESTLFDFTIDGIVVEGFPKNGIQTRFVDGFQIIRSKSVNNLNNGLYPTLSMNGKVVDCVSTGSLDAGLWVAGSRQVEVFNNHVTDSTTGIEITVSKDVIVKNNNVWNNVVGIGLYHANMAGTSPDFPPYDNWVIEKNRIFDNNRLNTSPPGSFQSFLPSGIGILLVGVRGHTISSNLIVGNDFTGLGVAGFCTVQALVFQVDCSGENGPIDGDPSAGSNTFYGNDFSSNGSVGLPFLGLPGKDIMYLQSDDEFPLPRDENPELDNCFKKNVAVAGGPATFLAMNFPTMLNELPTGGCAA